MRYKMFSLGYEILDHCNLNCKHCCHFSNLKAEKEKTLEFITEDVKFLAEHIELQEFKISGGEPTIHSQICEILLAMRQILGNKVKIIMLTNGLKLSSMPERFFKLAKYLGIFISIAKYPIKARYDEAEAKLKEYGISYGVLEMFEFGNIFKRVDPTGTQNPQESFDFCQDRKVCPYYNNKHISICRATVNAAYLNEKYDYKIEYNFVPVDQPHEVIERYLTTPCKTCRFCKKGVHMEPWTVS
jgi:hypothetical protein